MINVGIIGSSFSEGDQNNPIEGNPNSKFLTDIFKEYNTNKEINFYSLAKGGAGTEEYLGDIIYLKQKCNIKILLIEIIENRSGCNSLKTELKNLDLSSVVDKKEFIRFYQKNYRRIYKHLGTKTVIDNTGWIKKEIAFITLHDIVQTLNLCDLLDIKPIVWCYRLLEDDNSFFSKYFHKLKLPLEKFDNFETVSKRFFKKYKGKKELYILDKGDHLNDNANIELVKDFLLPKIYELT